MRAQTSTEFLVILAVLFVLFLAFLVLSQQEFVGVNTARIEQQARNTVDSLGAAAKEVYSQGEGARKRVYVDIPGGYNYTNSSVSNRSISLRVLNSDFVSTFDFDVVGQLPSSSGPQYIWVISEGTRVRIGISLLSLNKPSIVVTMLQNSTVTDNFDVRNEFTSNVNVTINTSWGSSAVTMTPLPTSFTLSPSVSNTVTLTFVSNPSAVGFYTGSISITGTSGTLTETLNLPVTVEIELPPSGAPPLFIIPSYWNASLLANDNVSKSFDVCTNSFTSVSDVTFTTTVGPAGSWVGSLSALPAMGPDTCLSKVFTLAVPNATAPGNYTGTITGTGGGVAGAIDTVALSITVGGNLSDIQGPLVSNIMRIPTRPFVGDPVTIRALCDDRTRGNNNIIRGEISMDGGAWNIMSATDGIYNAPAENVSYQFYSLGFGQHNATLRCTDSFTNVGPNSTYTFNVMKEFLFVTKDNGQSGSEADWTNWLNTHSSNESYAWNRDIVHRVVVIDSSFDMNRYATVILAEDGVTSGSTGSSLVTKIINFVGAGGSVVLVDEALDNPAEDLGMGGSTGTHTELYTTMQNNVHYITNGLPCCGVQYTIFTTATKIYHIRYYPGTILSTDYNTSTHLTHAQLGQSGRYVTWGPTRPYRFNANGNYLTTRVFDFAINISTVGTS